MRGIIVAALAAVVGQASVARADCVELPGNFREMNVPAGWTAREGTNYTGGIVLTNPELIGNASVMPLGDGSCANSELTTFRVSPQTVVFGSGYGFYFDGEEDGVAVFGACLDAGHGAVEIQVRMDPMQDSRDPRWLELTEAIREMLVYDVQCAWEPVYEAPTPTPSKRTLPGQEWRFDLSAVAGAGKTFDPPPDFAGVLDLRLTVSGLTSVLAIEPHGRVGTGTGGGRILGAGLRAGFSFGKAKRVALMGGFEARDEAGLVSLGLGIRAVVSWPLPKQRLRLLVWADADWVGEEIMPTPATGTEFGDPDFTPSVAAMVSRRWMLLGVEVREMSSATVASLLLGVRYDN